jgi:hypothetical protein
MTGFILRALLPWSAPVWAAEPCLADPCALLDAVRADDRDAADALLRELGRSDCDVDAVLGAPALVPSVEVLRDALPSGERSQRWVPALALSAELSPGGSGTSRLDAGRAGHTGVRWSVGLGLTFARRPSLPPEDATLSRGEVRSWAVGVERQASARGTTSAGWRVDAFARWVGARLTAALGDATLHERSDEAFDLRGRVLRVLERQEDLARLTAWLGAGPA